MVRPRAGDQAEATTVVVRRGDDLYPTEVLIAAGEGGLTRDSIVLLNQIRSIEATRLRKKLGRLRADTMVRVDRALAISLALVEF